MANRLAKPTDPYDPAWTEYRAQNPGLILSLSAAAAGEGGEGEGGEGPDLSFIPDTFKGEDGSYDTGKFAEHYGEIATSHAQTQERIAALPADATGYAFKLPETFAWPEGFEPSAFKQPVMGDDGKPKMGEDGKPMSRDMEFTDLIDDKDPDIARLQTVFHENKIDPSVMSAIAEIFVSRELRGLTAAGETYGAEMQKLGPDSKTRIDRVSRTIRTSLPEAQANALIDDITSADTLRALETLFKPGQKPPGQQGGGKDYSSMTPADRVMAGLRDQKRA